MDLGKSIFLGIRRRNVIIVIRLRRFKMIVSVRKYFIVQNSARIRINHIMLMYVK
jgi:hypothetical protein